VKAAFILVNDHHADSHSHQSSELGGAISAINATAKTMTVNGVQVDASASTFDQAGKTFADLKTGGYVVLKGVYDSSGVLKAHTIVLRGVPVPIRSCQAECPQRRTDRAPSCRRERLFRLRTQRPPRPRPAAHPTRSRRPVARKTRIRST
jgi:hypothetical protein